MQTRCTNDAGNDDEYDVDDDGDDDDNEDEDDIMALDITYASDRNRFGKNTPAIEIALDNTYASDRYRFGQRCTPAIEIALGKTYIKQVKAPARSPTASCAAATPCHE